MLDVKSKRRSVMGWLRRGEIGAGLGCLFVDEVMDDGPSRAEPWCRACRGTCRPVPFVISHDLQTVPSNVCYLELSCWPLTFKALEHSASHMASLLKYS